MVCYECFLLYLIFLLALCFYGAYFLSWCVSSVVVGATRLAEQCHGAGIWKLNLVQSISKCKVLQQRAHTTTVNQTVVLLYLPGRFAWYTSELSQNMTQTSRQFTLCSQNGLKSITRTWKQHLVATTSIHKYLWGWGCVVIWYNILELHLS